MKYNVLVPGYFKKQAKKLLKKYPSLKQELDDLVELLSVSPEQGVSVGKGCYKIRLAVKSKGGGKSGGMRVITYLQLHESNVYLVTIYDKSDKATITNKELLLLLSYTIEQ